MQDGLPSAPPRVSDQAKLPESARPPAAGVIGAPSAASAAFLRFQSGTPSARLTGVGHTRPKTETRASGPRGRGSRAIRSAIAISDALLAVTLLAVALTGCAFPEGAPAHGPSGPAAPDASNARPFRPARELSSTPSALDPRRVAVALAPGPATFREARPLLEALFPGPGRSLYCDCAYDTSGRVDPAACGLPSSLGKGERRTRMEWEHVVPAATLGKTFPEWREGHPRCGRKTGRSCLRKISAEFNRMEADLFNIRPAVGSINELRGSRALSEIAGDRRLGRCEFEVDGGQAEPRDAIKGDLARIYLDMETTYPGRDLIDPRDRDDYIRWSREDPVDPAECALVRAIAKKQGRPNRTVEEACRAAGL